MARKFTFDLMSKFGIIVSLITSSGPPQVRLGTPVVDRHLLKVGRRVVSRVPEIAAAIRLDRVVTWAIRWLTIISTIVEERYGFSRRSP